MPDANATHSAPPPGDSRSAMAASSARHEALSVRPYPSTPGRGPLAGSRWYGAASTGPGMNGRPATGSGRPACAARVPSPYRCVLSSGADSGDADSGGADSSDAEPSSVTRSLRLRFAAHQRRNGDAWVDALVANPLDLFCDG